MKDSENKTWKSVVLRNNINKYILQPPNNGNKLTNLWKLEVSFNGGLLRKNSKDFSSYGDLILSSHPIQICSQEKIQKNIHYVIIYTLISCATLQTTVNLNTQLVTKCKTLEVGFQKFENAKILFYPKVSKCLLSNESRLIHNWISCENVKYNDLILKTKYKLLNFASLKYSWRMATAKCHEYEMTLPHLENEQRTREFVSYILKGYALPVYAMFIGLVKKVRFCF